jgi:hypothetical protein
MIVSRETINDIISSGIRISCVVDQNLAIAKHIISRQIQKPMSEMIAFYVPNGDVAVIPKNPLAHKA